MVWVVWSEETWYCECLLGEFICNILGVSVRFLSIFHIV